MTDMPMLRAALYGAAAASLYVMYVSWHSGFAPEIAVVRGVIAFMVIAFIGYLAELVVSTVPPAASESEHEHAQAARAGAADATPAALPAPSSVTASGAMPPVAEPGRASDQAT